MDLLKKYGVVAGFIVIAIAILMAFVAKPNDVQTMMTSTPLAIAGLALVIVGKR